MKKPDWDSLQTYAWNYFEYHAGQRMNTFNFYLIICTILATGFVTIAEKDHPSASGNVLGAVIGILFPFFSWVFWQLDNRNRFFIKNAEKALMNLEKNIPARSKDDPPIRIFTYSEKRREILRGITSGKYSYSYCFRFIFILFSFLGLCAAAYMVIFNSK